MVIRASSGREVDALLADLRSEHPITRDSAIARLTVIGTRAVQKLMLAAGDRDGSADTRAAALRALEGIGDPRTLPLAIDGFTHPDPQIASASIGLARAFLRGPHGVEMLERLTLLAVNQGLPSEVRLTALRAIAELGGPTVAPILSTLRDDLDDKVQAVARGSKAASQSPDQVMARAAAGDASDEPETLRRAIGSAGAAVSLTTLQAIVEKVREKGESDAARRDGWMSARAAAHLALAQRGSRLALYDLRETIAAAPSALPLDFLNAMAVVGDAASLESIASAYERTGAESPDSVWNRHLRQAFAAIVERHQLTKRHAAIRKIEKRWPAAVASLMAQ